MSGDQLALDALFQASGVGKLHLFRHYLYFCSESEGADAAEQLQRMGYTTEEIPEADGSWLVRATHEVRPTSDGVSLLRQAMERLANRFGGEYDGWEAETRLT